MLTLMCWIFHFDELFVLHQPFIASCVTIWDYCPVNYPLQDRQHQRFRYFSITPKTINMALFAEIKGFVVIFANISLNALIDICQAIGSFMPVCKIICLCCDVVKCNKIPIKRQKTINNVNYPVLMNSSYSRRRGLLYLTTVILGSNFRKKQVFSCQAIIWFIESQVITLVCKFGSTTTDQIFKVRAAALLASGWPMRQKVIPSVPIETLQCLTLLCGDTGIH